MQQTTQILLIGLLGVFSALNSAGNADEIAQIADVLSLAERALAKVEATDERRQELRQSVERAKALVAALAAAKRGDGPEVVAQLKRRQRGDGEAAQRVRRRERARIVRSLLETGALAEAERVAAAGEADAVLLAEVAAAHAEAGQRAEAAANFLRAAGALAPGDSARVPRQAGDDGRRRDIAFIMRPQIQSGDLDEAKKTARAFSSIGYGAMALVMIAEAQTERGDNQTAATTLAEAAGFAKKFDERKPAPLEPVTLVNEYKMRLWAEIGAAQALAKDPAAVDAFQRAKQIAADFDRAERRAQGLSEVASFEARGGHRKQAQQTFAAAVGEANKIRPIEADFGLTQDPRPGVLEEIAVRQARAGDVEAALKTAAAAGPKQAVAAIRRMAQGIGETADATLVGRLTVAAGKWKEDPTVRRWLTFANAASGRTGAAIELADGNAPLLSVIVRVRAAARDFRGAMRALDDFPKDSNRLHDEALAILAREQAEAGETDAALKTIAAARGGPFDSVLEKIARDYARSGKLQQALQAAGQIKNAYRRSSAHWRVALSVMVRSEFDDALRVTESIELPGQRRSVLARIAQVLTAAMSPKAEAAVKKALRECDAIKDAQRRDEAKWSFFWGLARAQFRAGDAAAGRRTLRRLDMLQNVRAEYRANQQAQAAVLIAKSGNLAAAMNDAEQIKNPAERAVAFLNIAEALIHQFQ